MRSRRALLALVLCTCGALVGLLLGAARARAQEPVGVHVDHFSQSVMPPLVEDAASQPDGEREKLGHFFDLQARLHDVDCMVDIGLRPGSAAAMFLRQFPGAAVHGFYAAHSKAAEWQGALVASWGDPKRDLQASSVKCSVLRVGGGLVPADASQLLLQAARTAAAEHVVLFEGCAGDRREVWDAAVALGELQHLATRVPSAAASPPVAGDDWTHQPWCVGKFDPLVTDDRMTAVFAGHSMQRFDNHHVLLEHMSRLPHLVAHVVFLWNGPEPYPLSEAELNAQSLVPVTLVQGQGNSLNSRWLPRAEVQTPAIFVFDDDLLMQADSVRCMFRAWQRHRQRLVGVYTRAAYLPYQTHESPDAYAIVLPRSVVLATEHLQLYSEVMPQALRDLVDDQAGHCDDIALNAAVSAATGLPPLRVQLGRDPVELFEGSSGLGRSSSRKQERADCMIRIAEAYPPGTFMTTSDVFRCPF